ncbi:hypothetical protein SELMODRAFT_428110 [Selaginella moellendorffii]|uniref:Uncharacterized protein n=1 Tax=Selaginella moellendorffii TaxID=88036 RepID=D8T1S1_SELML|nr:hypothetical protein SELMODRAFT_428110 [Selaginella moellendorffii]
MGHIRTRKHTRNCPCPRKPPIPKTGGPLHIRPWTISDFPHRRRQFLLRESKRVIPDYDEYFGQKCTDITETQRHLVPLHALHPNLLNAPDPFHNRKVTSVTEYISHMGKPRTGPLITTEASPYHGNKATSITEYLRYVPPAHLGKDGQDAVLPHYGIKATDATGAFDERAEPTILTYMLPHRPKTAPTVVFPQHVSPAVLVNAIAERRRMFLEKPQPPSMPNSARAPDKSAPMGEALVNTGCSTARSDAGISYGDTTARPKTASSLPETKPSAPMSARLPESSCPTPRSDRAAPPTPKSSRPNTANDAQTMRTIGKTGTDQTPRTPTVTDAASRHLGLLLVPVPAHPGPISVAS